MVQAHAIEAHKGRPSKGKDPYAWIPKYGDLRGIQYVYIRSHIRRYRSVSGAHQYNTLPDPHIIAIIIAM